MVWYLELLYREYHGIPCIKNHRISISKKHHKDHANAIVLFVTETNTSAYTHIIGEMINQTLHLKSHTEYI